MKPLRIFCYVQHLSGVGHMMRTQLIAAALAGRHRVALLDGGRELPFPAGVERVQVPRIARRGGVLTVLDGDMPLAQTLVLRQQLLQRMLREVVPDVILVEHFPFSKWELQPEIEVLLASARALNPALTVIASLRDISPPTRHEAGADYAETVLALLERHFHALLVHADPALCTLRQYFPAIDRSRVPVFHTGIVADLSPPPVPDASPAFALERGYAVASVGGGADRHGLLRRAADAWRLLAAADVLAGRVLLLFGGLDRAGEAPDAVVAGDGIEGAVRAMGFSPHFRYWLQGAALSISCAGYNTCANLLVAGTPALLLPDPTMSDQPERARLLERRAVARCVPPRDAGEDPLPAMIAQGLARPRTSHAIDTDGARASVRCIEGLASGLHAE